MKMKRMLAMFLSLTLLMSVLPVIPVVAAEAEKDPMDNFVVHAIDIAPAKIEGTASPFVYGHMWQQNLSIDLSGVAKTDLALSFNLYYSDKEDAASNAFWEEAVTTMYLSTGFAGAGKKVEWSKEQITCVDGTPLKPGVVNNVLLPFSVATESGGTFDPETDVFTFIWPEFKNISKNTWDVSITNMALVDTSRAAVKEEEEEMPTLSMDNFVLGEIYKTKAATVSGAEGAYVYGGMWTDGHVLNCAGVAKEDLALSLRLFYLDIDDAENNSFWSEAASAASIFFLSTEFNGGKKLSWKVTDLKQVNGEALVPGQWNNVLLPFTVATEGNGTFNPETDVLTFIWPEFVGIKKNTWIVRMADVNVVDMSRPYVAPQAPEYDTTYNVASIPFTMNQTTSYGKTFANNKSFTAINASKHDTKKLALQLDITATGNVMALRSAQGQIELTSSGKCDVNELSASIGSLAWEEGAKTYEIPLSSMSVTGGAINYANINYIRVYISGWGSTFDDSVSIKVTGARLVDVTTIEAQPSLPTLFSDGMMFQQNKPMNVFGYGEAGDEMTAELYRGAEKLETVTATAAADGRFDLSFSARAGGYDTYSIRVFGGELDTTIKDVVIGELWVAGGQSNMELTVGVSLDMNTMMAESSEYVRIYKMPTRPSGDVLMDPARDVKGAYWINGTDIDVTAVSALAYAFANDLQKKLDVPVGFLNTSIGGTVIEAWLSREAIGGNAELQAELLKRGLYYDEEFWSTSNGTMSTWYNQKVGPLAGINVAGTIWYQGESNSNRSELYPIELKILKESWGEIFGYENGDMPLIFTQVAPYRYDNGNSNQQHLGYLAMHMEDGWALCDPDTTSMLTIYDLPLDHMKDDGVSSTDPIHPRAKKPVGERFAAAAMNMLYGGTEEFTAPVFKSMEIRDGAIYLTFDRVGSGLKSIDGSANLHGFTIAGADGVYVNAEAVLVDADTVRVWNNRVNAPKHVMYAFDNFNQAANLMNSAGIPASPFRTVELNDTTLKPDSSLKYFTAQDWMYADRDVWVFDSANTAQFKTGYRPSFKVTGATYGYVDKMVHEGTGALRVDFDGDFTVAPILTYESVKKSYAAYNTLSVWVMNAGDTAVELTLKVNGNTAVKTVGGESAVTLAANAETYQIVTFDLSAVDATSFTFGGTATAAGTLLMDGFSFGMTAPTWTEDTLNENEFPVSLDGYFEALSDTAALEGVYTAESIATYSAYLETAQADWEATDDLLAKYDILKDTETAFAAMEKICYHENTSVVGAVDPTCTEAGRTGDVVCDDCGETVKSGEEIPPHKTEERAQIGGVCPFAGTAAGVWCTVCEKYISGGEAIPAHVTTTREKREATCTRAGNEAGEWCNECRHYVSGGEEIPAHKTEQHERVASTCTTDGRTAGVWCTECEQYVTGGALLPAHLKEERAEIPATETEAGRTAGTWCIPCGKYVTGGEIIPPTGGGEVPTPGAKLGDVNGDNKIDSTDARLVLQYAVGKIKADAITIDVADVNGDNKVDSTDARLILQHAVGKIAEFPA